MLHFNAEELFSEDESVEYFLEYKLFWYLEALANLRKATVSFDMTVRPSVRPPVRIEQLESYWTNFDKILYASPILWNPEIYYSIYKSQKKESVRFRGFFKCVVTRLIF
jgi:hypothetical protein